MSRWDRRIRAQRTGTYVPDPGGAFQRRRWARLMPRHLDAIWRNGIGVRSWWPRETGWRRRYLACQPAHGRGWFPHT